MNRDKRVANYLLLLYGIIALGALSKPKAVPVQAFKVYVSYLLNPAPFYGAQAIDRLSGLPTQVSQILTADMENRHLREELKKLELVEAQLASYKQENDRLRATLGFKPAQGKALRWAKVMERDSLNWYRYLMIDAGKDDGIDINSPVLGVFAGRLGAVGRVTETGPRWAKVLLLTDELSSVAAYIPEKQWEGLVEGQGGPRMRMNYLALDAQCQIGDTVSTSLTSATFPADIVIGTVTQIFQQDPFLTFQSVEVTPAIPASALKEVLILVPQKQQP